MRGSWAVVAFVVLASGCSEDPASADPAADVTAEAFTVPGSEAPAGMPPAMSFASGEFEQTTTFDGSFTVPDTCIQVDCRQTIEVDLTQQVPADAAVEVTITVTTDHCVNPVLRIEEGASVRDVAAGREGVAARIARTATGVVTLVLSNCSPVGPDITAGSAPVHAEVRTAVRPTVLPTRVPVAVTLAAGDRLVAMGDELEQLIVYAPGLQPVRLDAPFEFNASSAGAHLVVAIGIGEAMLHGPATPMVALPIHTTAGEPRPIPSSGELSWDVEVPGIPVSVTMELASQDGPGLTYRGNVDLSASQAGTAFFEVHETGCVAICSVGAGRPVSQSWARYGSNAFPEGIGIGPITFSVASAQIMGYDAVETVSWVTASP